MARSKKCCCFSNTLSAAMACAVYSINYSAMYLIWNAYEWYQYTEMVKLKGEAAGDIEDVFIIHVISLVQILVSSCVLMYGLAKDKRMLFIPYMVSLSLLVLLQLVAWIVLLSNVGFYTDASIAGFLFWLALQFLNIACVVVVVTYYKQLRVNTGGLEEDTIY